MATVKSGINKVGNNYYQSITRNTPDGGVGTALYRVNADGSGGVPIYDVDKPAGSTEFVKVFDPNATAEEKRLLSDPNSQLSKVRAQQIKSSNPYGDNPTAEQKTNLDKASGGSGNTANNTDGSKNPNENGENSTDSKASQESFDKGSGNLDQINKEIKDRDDTRKPTEYGNFRYPLTIDLKIQDCIKFTMGSYSPRSVTTAGIKEGNPIGARTFTPGGTVILPIQPSISDSNNVRWADDELDAAKAIAATAALAAIGQGAEGFASALGSGAELLKQSSGDVKTSISAFFAQEASGTKGLLTRTTGAIVNPNMELLFQGPQLRNFTFTFIMSAREPNESKAIRNIIRFFKQGMSVKRAKTALFLKTPHIFKIEYLHKSSLHPWMNKIKECALTGCNVNYTPSGNYATYNDGAMTSYELSLTFGELEPIYDDDYGKGSKTSETEIGY